MASSYGSEPDESAGGSRPEPTGPEPHGARPGQFHGSGPGRTEPEPYGGETGEPPPLPPPGTEEPGQSPYGGATGAGYPSGGPGYAAPQGGYPPPPGAPPGGTPPGAYPPPGAGYPPAGPPPGARTNVMAILALVFAFVFAPAGIVLGHVAKKQIRETGEQGGGLATAGLVLSYIFTVGYVIGCCGWLTALIFTGGRYNNG